MNKKTKKRSKSQNNRQRNVIINNSKKENIENAILNQFICSECYHTNLIMEDEEHITPKYEEKKVVCTSCHKHTDQICVKDKTIIKGILETSVIRNPKEEKAYQMIKKTNSRSS